MKKKLLVVGFLVLTGAADDLLACGDKFLVGSRGTRYQRAAVARQPANILVYINPASTLSQALEKVAVEATLRKAGYRPTTVSAPGDFERALRQGGWDLIVADLADSAALRGRVEGGGAPMVLPVVFNVTGAQLAQARKDYKRIVKAPVKSQGFLDAVDEALALKKKLRTTSTD